MGPSLLHVIAALAAAANAGVSIYVRSWGEATAWLIVTGYATSAAWRKEVS